MNITKFADLQIDLSESGKSSESEEDKSGYTNSPSNSVSKHKRGFFRRSPSNISNKLISPIRSDQLKDSPQFPKRSQFGFQLRPLPAPLQRGKSGDTVGSNKNVIQLMESLTRLVQHKRQAVLKFEAINPELNQDKIAPLVLTRKQSLADIGKSDIRPDEEFSDEDSVDKYKVKGSASFYDLSDTESKQLEDVYFTRRNSLIVTSQREIPVISIPIPKLTRNQVSMIIPYGVQDKEKEEPSSAIQLKTKRQRRGSTTRAGAFKKQKELSVPRRQDYFDSDDIKTDTRLMIVKHNKEKMFEFKRFEKQATFSREGRSMLDFGRYPPKDVLFDSMERGRIEVRVTCGNHRYISLNITMRRRCTLYQKCV